MKVYIVTEGSYSDYRMVAAFSTKALAAAFCAASHGKYDSIETLELDEPSEWAWVARVRMCRDGELFYPGASIRWTEVPYKSYQTGVSGGSIQWVENHVVVGADHDNEPPGASDRAIKVTNELRTRLIATGEWV